MLYEARQSRVPIPPLTTSHPELTADDAYDIQQAFVDLLLHDGGDIVGYKLGLTSKGMQDLLGIDQPDYAPVLSSFVYEPGTQFDVADYIQPKVEAEIALTLDKPLRGPGVTIDDVRGAVGGAMAAIEMVDSRIEDWKIKFVDTVSDLASTGAIVTSGNPVPLDYDIRLTGMVITKNGETMATGAGAAALGNPLYTVAWLANTLAPYDVTLEAGHFIMTGSLHAAFDVVAGDQVTARFDRLGEVTMGFGE